ncbi:MAG: SDR family oxidoreductase [Bacilli bacterium]|nr:SDR family oxidoreductase [Bacilli bacterium]
MRKNVLITGSSSGIGKEIARVLAKDYDVILHYNNGYESAKLLKEELDKKYNRDYLMVKCDLSKEEEIDSMLNTIYKRYNSIDILINNAGIAIDTLFEDKTKDNFMKTLDINLIAPFLLCKKIGPKMKENKYGVIINMSSTNGIDTSYIESLDYDASKAGLISLSKNLANYFAPYVRVNTICPGWVNTEMNSNLDNDFIKSEEDKILLGRFANPEEIANLVEFLISDKASYINNSIIRIDGGIKC